MAERVAQSCPLEAPTRSLERGSRLSSWQPGEASSLPTEQAAKPETTEPHVQAVSHSRNQGDPVCLHRLHSRKRVTCVSVPLGRLCPWVLLGSERHKPSSRNHVGPPRPCANRSKRTGALQDTSRPSWSNTSSQERSPNVQKKQATRSKSGRRQH